MLVLLIHKVWRLHGKDAEVRSKIADMAVMSFVARQCQERAESNAATCITASMCSLSHAVRGCAGSRFASPSKCRSQTSWQPIEVTLGFNSASQTSEPVNSEGRGEYRDSSARSCFEVSLGFGLHCGWAIEAGQGCRRCWPARRWP